MEKYVLAQSQDRFLPHDAPVFGRQNPVRARGFGRGPRPKMELQFPSKQTPLILQCNINGLTTPATRTELDQMM
ncbi:hypothetical protein TNCV_4644081 [Trichonephila clavipes]|nr:hypothetical protein TNCV_4644081 [Trichonephila clavipes]